MALVFTPDAEGPGKASRRPMLMAGPRVIDAVGGQIDFDSVYPTGGETLDFTSGGEDLLRTVLAVFIEDKNGFAFEYDYANKKVKALRKGGIGVSTDSMNLTDDDDAATNGTAIYAHIDDVTEQGSYLAHLESPTAGNADTYVRLYTGGPTVAIQDDDAATNGGFQVFVDEDGTDGFRLLADFDRPGDANAYVMASDGRFVLIDDTDTPGTPGDEVYVDDDGATDTARLLFISATNADATNLIHAYGGEVANATDLSGLTDVRVLAFGYR